VSIAGHVELACRKRFQILGFQILGNSDEMGLPVLRAS